MITTIQLKRGTSTNWEQKNPILADGEVGLITDSLKGEYKVGNGKDAWKTLPIRQSIIDTSGFATKEEVNTKIGILDTELTKILEG